jgi:cytoplasmic FMR1 interacting protein
LQLLGRSIDFADLLTQRVNNMIRANLDLVIARFEAADITSIIELETMLDNIKLTHHLLSQYLPLDQFDALLAEVNESTSLVSLHGRILLHVRNVFLAPPRHLDSPSLARRLSSS